MKNFLILAALFIFINGAYSFENITIPNSNEQNPISQSSISNEEFEPLEKLIFNKTFKTDTTKKRLSRLEKEIFGMEQKGTDEDRFENLLSAADFYESNNDKPQYYTYEYAPKNYYQNYENKDNISKSPSKNTFNYDIAPESDKKKPSKIKQFFADFADALTSGVITGYTTPVYYDIDPFAPNFIGYPSHTSTYVNTPVYNYPSYHQRHTPGRTKYYPYNNYPPPPPPYSYSRNPYQSNNIRPYSPYRNNYYPYGTGNRIYGSGANVKIID